VIELKLGKGYTLLPLEVQAQVKRLLGKDICPTCMAERHEVPLNSLSTAKAPRNKSMGSDDAGIAD